MHLSCERMWYQFFICYGFLEEFSFESYFIQPFNILILEIYRKMLYLRFISSFKILENLKCLQSYTEKELYFTGRNCFYIFLEISSEIQTIHDELYLNLTKWLKDDFRSRVYTANTPREKIEDVFFNWKMKQNEASYMIVHYTIWNLCILRVFLSLMCYTCIF